MPRSTNSASKIRQFDSLAAVPGNCIVAPSIYFVPRNGAKPFGSLNGANWYHYRDVSPLRTQAEWRRAGRKIRAGEKPIAHRGHDRDDVFADWQTA
jgi:hypothetical protein